MPMLELLLGRAPTAEPAAEVPPTITPILVIGRDGFVDYVKNNAFIASFMKTLAEGLP